MICTGFFILFLILQQQQTNQKPTGRVVDFLVPSPEPALTPPQLVLSQSELSSSYSTQALVSFPCRAVCLQYTRVCLPLLSGKSIPFP